MYVIREGDTLTLESEQRSSDVQFHSESVPAGASEPVAVIHVGYRRCNDFDIGNNAGQDYIVVRADQHRVVGVVADGVGQSFYGDLAGKRVAKFLAELLWTQRERTPSDQELATALIAEARVFQSEVDAFVIPTHLTPLLQEALANTRVKGSQAVFAAFVLEFGRGSTVIYQVGDVDAYVAHKDGAAECVQAPKRGRWSSGGRTDLLLRSSRFEGIRQVLVQSDGATDAWASSVRLDDDMPRQFEELARTRASIDDISVVAVSRSAKAPSRPVPPPSPPEPKDEPRGQATSEIAEAAAEKTVVTTVVPAKSWLAVAFTAGALTSLAFVCAFQQSGRSTTTQKPAARAQPPQRPSVVLPPAKTVVVPLSLTTSEYVELKRKAGSWLQPTAQGEASVWTAVPRRLNAARFRLQTQEQTVTVSPIARDDARSLFRIVLVQLPASPALPAVAELLDDQGGVIASGKLSIRPRDVKPTTRGYYLLEPAPQQ